jgi:trimethylamine---corrinoid protein Co-methyltransferase
MKSDFVYPAHADRQAPEAWLASGAPNINSSARKTVKETLGSHFPPHISAGIEQELRSRFNIRLPATRMKAP